MGLFNKQQPDQSHPDDPVEVAEAIFDDRYRQELRQAGVEHFKKLLDESAVDMRHDIDKTMQQVSVELKEYMTQQLDVTIATVNSEITHQLHQRINEFDRIASEAQDQAAQSLSRSAQEVYKKYQNFSASLQQAITSQEVMMISVYQDNKAQVAAAQKEQDKALRVLSETASSARQQSEQLMQVTRRNIDQQAKQFLEVYQQNMARVKATKDAQDKALENMNASSSALAAQHQQLGEFLDKSVADQKAMLVDVINDNMARIIEHYLVGALGEQSDLSAQLPSILEQMEQNKQAMVDDMKL